MKFFGSEFVFLKLCLFIFITFVARLIVVGLFPLTPDEAYYWVWSRHLQAGYIDHPPMVALWIRASTWIWGDTAFGVRFLGPIAFFVASLSILDAGYCLSSKSIESGIRAFYLFNATILCGLGMITMTPDTPLIFFSALALWALSRALYASCHHSRILWWLCVGLFLGLGGVSKYTAIFPALGVAGFVLSSRQRLWRQIGPWLGGILACLVALPVVWWNAAHHWCSFIKQGGRIGDWQPVRALQFLGELLVGQIGLLTPLIFLCVVIGIWHLWKTKKHRELLWFVFPGFFFFCLHALGDRVQANWPGVFYPALALIGGIVGWRWRSAVWSGGIICLSIVVQAIWQPISLPAHWNPIVRQTAGWKEMAMSLEKMAIKQNAQAIATPDYAIASILAFYRHERVPILGQDSRWRALDNALIKKVPRALIIEDAHYTMSGSDIIIRYAHQQSVRGYRIYIRDDVQGIRIP